MYKILLDNSSKKSVPPRKGGIGAQVEVVTRQNYEALPQQDPTSTSHLLGTSNGTAFSMIREMFSASDLSFTEIATSSCICMRGMRPDW